MFGLHY